MAFEETREQQQMYNYFRSCIYIFLIIEIVMNLPITADNRVTQFVLDLFGQIQGVQFHIGLQGGRADLHLCGLYRNQGKEGLKFDVQRRWSSIRCWRD